MLERGNQELIAAAARVRDAEGDLVVAGQKQNPNISLGTTFFQTPPGQSDTGIGDHLRNYTDYNVGISVPIERGGKRALRKAVAGKGMDAARADLESLRISLRQQLAQIYHDLALAERKELLSRQYADLYDKSVAAMQLRLKSGDIAAVDLARIEMEAEQARIQVAANRSERREIQTALAKILGMGAGADKLRTQTAWDWDTAPIGEALTQVDAEALAQRRPDVVAAQLRVDQARQAIKLAESLRTGDLTLSTTLDRQPPGNSIARDNISFNVSIPLQVRYQYRGEIAKAYAELDMAQAELARAHDEVANEIQQARDALTMKSEQVKRLYAGVVPRARDTAQAAEFAYQHGASSLTDLLDARRSLQSLLLDVAAARADYAKALASWHIILGDDTPSP